MIALLHYWSHDLSVKATVRLVGIDKKHVIHWHKMFRRVCRWWLTRNPRQIGGLGVRVEIDEALIAKRKYHRGRIVPPRWVFGGISPANQEGFMVFVPNRKRRTLLPLIQDHVAAGSIIHSGPRFN